LNVHAYSVGVIIRNWLGRVLLLAGLLAQASSAKAQQPTPAPASSKHSLWKVQGQQNSLYLLGSIHVLKKEDYPLAKVIDDAFTNAQIAVFETEIDKMEDPAMAMKLALKGRLPAGETLRDQLSPPVYSSFKDYVAKTGMPMLIFDSLTPGMAAITLVTLELKRLNLDPQYGLDKHFFDLATAAGKKIVPLETLDFQLGLLTDFSKEEGELMMKSTLKEIDQMEKDLGEMLKAWQIGDATKLEKLLNEAKEDAPAIYKRLVTDRNQNWLPRLEELAKGKENAIVIVGAGHLVGTNGVVELLRRKGFKVVQQ
jgi:uncharacterized protein YbaP (TraB family)